MFRIIGRLLPKAPVISVIEITPDLVRFQVSFRRDDGSTLKLLVVKPFQRELKYKNYPIGKKRELHVPLKKDTSKLFTSWNFISFKILLWYTG